MEDRTAMAIDSKYYIHEADRAAFKALKSIPGFNQLVRAYLKTLGERQFKILNMSSCIRMNENQLSEYYNYLPPICEKLGIQIPELYLELDVNPNSYTAGDSNPFIVITSGLFETLPEELIPTVIAHECGHIACHHSLYSTMGNILLNASSTALNAFLKYGNLVSMPLIVAYYYWMRCSELSADRAAILCDGTSEKMTDVCMRLAGFDKDINAIANKAEFMKQAREYREMVGNSKWDKTLEFLVLSSKDHPLLTVRALECSEWVETDQYKRLLDGSYLLEGNTSSDNETDNGCEHEDSFEKEMKENKKTFSQRFSSPFRKNGKKKNDSDPQLEVEALPTTMATPDEIRKYKELWDDGIITKEEFEAKKRQLLDLL